MKPILMVWALAASGPSASAAAVADARNSLRVFIASPPWGMTSERIVPAVLSGYPRAFRAAMRPRPALHWRMADRILWGAGTPRTMRAHWMLAELGFAYDRRPITSRSGETQTPAFIAINPSRKIPVLQDGDFILSESAAIVGYLAETYGAAKQLGLPAGARE